MESRKIDHISIAVRDLDRARKVWEPVIGKTEPDDSYTDESERIRVARYWLGGVGFELMESLTPDGPVAEWIARHGEGVMVFSLNVDDTQQAVTKLESEGYPFIAGPSGEKIRPFRECGFAFVHPKKMNNVLLELIDYRWDELKGR